MGKIEVERKPALAVTRKETNSGCDSKGNQLWAVTQKTTALGCDSEGKHLWAMTRKGNSSEL